MTKGLRAFGPVLFSLKFPYKGTVVICGLEPFRPSRGAETMNDP